MIVEMQNLDIKLPTGTCFSSIWDEVEFMLLKLSRMVKLSDLK